ncbi:MAG TPA: hypothetical protein VIZ17_01015 [Acetobacteraceae bacterium]
MTEAELRALVADCVAVWGVGGRVAGAADGGVEVASATGRCVIRAAGMEERPARWYVEVPERVGAGRASRGLPSVVAMLAALRRRLEGETGEG